MLRSLPMLATSNRSEGFSNPADRTPLSAQFGMIALDLHVALSGSGLIKALRQHASKGKILASQEALQDSHALIVSDSIKRLDELLMEHFVLPVGLGQKNSCL
jgi:hypothetical protein